MSQDKQKSEMSSQSKFLTIGLILAFGIGNGRKKNQDFLTEAWMLTRLAAYYTFNPSLRELKERRESERSR